MKAVVTLTLIAVALLAGGCGTTSGTSSTTTTPVAPAPAPTNQPPAATVIMRRLTFTPHTVTIHLGQTVRWVNKDNVAHNVTAENGTTFQSSTFGHGGSFTYKPLVTGTIPYTCTIHPNMMATLIVRP